MASTIETKINRISDNIAATYAAVEEMGGTVPENANSDNLPGAVRSIPQEGGSVTVDDTLTISGAAADAKVTGAALNQIKKDLSKLFGISETPLTEEQQAKIQEAIGILSVEEVLF